MNVFNKDLTSKRTGTSFPFYYRVSDKPSLASSIVSLFQEMVLYVPVGARMPIHVSGADQSPDGSVTVFFKDAEAADFASVSLSGGTAGTVFSIYSPEWLLRGFVELSQGIGNGITGATGVENLKPDELVVLPDVCIPVQDIPLSQTLVAGAPVKQVNLSRWFGAKNTRDDYIGVFPSDYSEEVTQQPALTRINGVDVSGKHVIIMAEPTSNLRVISDDVVTIKGVTEQ